MLAVMWAVEHFAPSCGRLKIMHTVPEVFYPQKEYQIVIL